MASNGLTVLSERAKGCSINKKKCADVVALNYGWPLDGLPDQCVCGTPYYTCHGMVWNLGRFTGMRHDEVTSLTDQILNEVCHDKSVEPMLIPLYVERLAHFTTKTSNDAGAGVNLRHKYFRLHWLLLLKPIT